MGEEGQHVQKADLVEIIQNEDFPRLCITQQGEASFKAGIDS